MFHDRERGLFDLNNILHRSGAQFMVVAGRRRVGKTTLLLEWARRLIVILDELPYTLEAKPALVVRHTSFEG